MLQHFAVLILSVYMIVLCPGVLSGQNYPTRPIQMLTSEPGGGTDFVARMIASEVSGNLGQQVMVVNRGAASGVIAAETVAKAPPDGYTLLLYGSAIWLMPYLRDKVPYDPVKDFAPITIATRSPILLVVHPSLPVKSVKELIALAKARPGGLNYGAGSIGSSTHIVTELFKAMAGVDVVRISYKGNGPALNALISGEVQLAFATPGSVEQHIQSGRLRALAVTTAQPSIFFPDLPTVASGLPGFEAASIIGLFAAARTPETIINKLNQSFVTGLKRTEVREKLLKVGIETVGSTPEQFGATIKSEMARLGKVIKDAGIRDE
jgi:tripartite-type tricarboxylate transporter receptor subunit TctC